MSTARICIVGAGAVGGLLAVRIGQGAASVSVLARGAHLERIASDGLILIEGEQRSVARLAASDDAGKLGRQDIVIVALKAQGLLAAAPSLAPLSAPLEALAGRPVRFVQTDWSDPVHLSRFGRSGEIVLMENTRFHPGEEANDPAFARMLADLGLNESDVVRAFGPPVWHRQDR